MEHGNDSPKENEGSIFDIFPNEITEHICSWAPIWTLIKLMKTCKMMKKIIEESSEVCGLFIPKYFKLMNPLQLAKILLGRDLMALWDLTGRKNIKKVKDFVICKHENVCLTQSKNRISKVRLYAEEQTTLWSGTGLKIAKMHLSTEDIFYIEAEVDQIPPANETTIVLGRLDRLDDPLTYVWTSNDEFTFDILHVCTIGGLQYMICKDGIYSMTREVLSQESIFAATSNTFEIFYLTENGIESFDPVQRVKKTLAVASSNGYRRNYQILYRQIDYGIRHLLVLTDDFITIFANEGANYKKLWQYKAAPGKVFTCMDERYNSIVACLDNNNNTEIVNIRNWFSANRVPRKWELQNWCPCDKVTIGVDRMFFLCRDGTLKERKFKLDLPSPK